MRSKSHRLKPRGLGGKREENAPPKKTEKRREEEALR